MNLNRRDFLKRLWRMSAGLSLLPFVELENVDLTLKENSTLVDIKSDTHISAYAKEIKGSPTIYFVGPGGNDVNDGLSWANRKLTLKGVEDVLVATGGTVYVGSGTYWDSGDIIRTGYHHGDPCTFCGIEHDNVPIGECEDYPNVRDISKSYWDLGEDGTFYKK